MGSRKRLQPWLKQCVEERKFGLSWIDERKQIFRIPWMHKNNPAWKEDYCQVFKEWSMLTNIYRKDDKWSTLKTRLRTALNKLPDFQEIKSMRNKNRPPFPYKVYRFITIQEGKRENIFNLANDLSPPFVSKDESVSNLAFTLYQEQRDTGNVSNSSESTQDNSQSITSPITSVNPVSLEEGKGTQLFTTNLEQTNVDRSFSNLHKCMSLDSNPQSTMVPMYHHNNSLAEMPVTFNNFDASQFSFLSSSEDFDCCRHSKSQPIGSQPQDYFCPTDITSFTFSTTKASCSGDNNLNNIDTKVSPSQSDNNTFFIYNNEAEFSCLLDQQQAMFIHQGKSVELDSLPSDLKADNTNDILSSDSDTSDKMNLYKAPPKISIILYKIFYWNKLVKEGNIYENGAHLYFGQIPQSSHLGHLPSNSKQLEKIEFPDVSAMPESLTHPKKQYAELILSNMEGGFLLYYEGGKVYIKRFCKTRIFAYNPLLGNIVLDRKNGYTVLDFTHFVEAVCTRHPVFLSFGIEITNESIKKLLVHVELTPDEDTGLQNKVQTHSIAENNIGMLSNNIVANNNTESLDLTFLQKMGALSL